MNHEDPSNGRYVHLAIYFVANTIYIPVHTINLAALIKALKAAAKAKRWLEIKNDPNPGSHGINGAHVMGWAVFEIRVSAQDEMAKAVVEVMKKPNPGDEWKQ